MEARSLASLNLLAANPPSYPVNPTEQAQEPLVLYLARVPGTRGERFLSYFDTHMLTYLQTSYSPPSSLNSRT